MSTTQLSVYFFIQAAIIITACQLVGRLAQRLGQPQVVGEMIAGVMLGPSLLGLLAPEAQQAIFPKQSMDVLYVAGQLGVGLYMFLVGTEFQTSLLRSRAVGAATVSLAGIAAPFALAFVLAPWLQSVPGLFAEGVRPLEVALFMGAAISITAFPMLARIIHERKLAGTALGTLALTAGAVDDAFAWCILAVVLASFGSAGWGSAYLAIAGGLAYGLLMIFLGHRLFRPLARMAKEGQPLSNSAFAGVLVLFCLGAWAMDAIGIHAVFGGFILGAALPKGQLTEKLREQLQPIVVVFLLPMFFTYSGLKTNMVAVVEPQMLLVCGAVLLASFGGKGVACWAAARLSGASPRESFAIGALMNARGLMELIIINIGLQAGVIKTGLFSILVLMAIVSTLAATPLFELAYRRGAERPKTQLEPV